jgi:AcrR family transcriptional regulator
VIAPFLISEPSAIRVYRRPPEVTRKRSNSNAAMSGTDTTSPPLSRGGEGRSTRDLILDAAERHFAERGFAGVAVRGIAADAGLKNQASLYHHFKNKRAIYEAVLARGIEPLMKMLSAPPTDTENAPTEALVDRMLDYLRRHPHLPRLLQRAGLDESRYLRKALGRYMRPLYDEGLRRLAISGTPWAPEELPYLAAGFYHLIFGYFADAAVLEVVVEADLRSAAALARERRFLKTVARKLLGTECDRTPEAAAP